MFIDITFLVLIFIACIKGLSKGLIIAVFSIVAFIAGLAAAMKLSAVVANKLAQSAPAPGKWWPVISFILVFVVVALLINLGGRLIQKSFEAVMLGWVNRLAGVLLFVFLYSFIFSIFLFYAVQLHIIKLTTIKASRVYPFIQPLGPKVISLVGSILPVFKDIFAQLEHFFGVVSNKLQH